MTDQEINEAVGRKLGAEFKFNIGGILYAEPMPQDYCHSIEAAWEIVEKLKFRLSPVNETDWVASGGHQSAMASCAPMAICLAFLKLP